MIIGFIGAGNMAGAIINNMVSSGIHPAGQIMVYDILKDKRDAFQKKGLLAAGSIPELVKSCDIIFLSVKPQNFVEVLEEARKEVKKEKLFVTIAAGISTGYVTRLLSCDCPVIRVMPNTPLLIGQGATAITRSEDVTDKEFVFIQSIFASCGTVTVLDESKMNAVISVNSTSPAYVYLLAKAVIEGGAKQGIDTDTSLKLFCQALIGSAEMMLKSGYTPDELIEMVSSPGGTTLKALDVFYEYRFEEMIDKAMLACTKRAEELGR
ncbi:MAG TPA: pyrroline-5-carboxylate reductase [Ruminococcaceae bacterium]|jgi:pyrroline-5-carboxylate reductase|nr:pyrroline-5-carboxylate reductase [Oscillospiraceae bacterium]